MASTGYNVQRIISNDTASHDAAKTYVQTVWLPQQTPGEYTVVVDDAALTVEAIATGIAWLPPSG